jgi:hypothetical protein
MKVWATAFGSACLFAALQLGVASTAAAQATRTWVSGVGDDANPCSRTAPCKTFAGAISKTAAGGEINAIDPGGYGAVTITKSITINGAGTLASVLASGTNGINVTAGPNDVVSIRNVEIFGSGSGVHGISFNSGASLYVENVAISGFTGQGIWFRPSGNSKLFVGSTTLRDNDSGAILIQPQATGNADAVLERVTMEDNYRGLRVEDGSGVVVRQSSATHNYANGFVALASSRPIDVSIVDSIASRNGAAGVYAGALTSIRLSNVSVIGNGGGLQTVGGGSITSFRNNTVSGNLVDGAPTSQAGQM